MKIDELQIAINHLQTRNLSQQHVELAIEALEKQLKDRWIPVSERLPEVKRHENGEPIEFIVMIKHAVVPTVLSIDDNGNWFDFMSRYYDVPEYLLDYYDVLAWKPLPEPYKEVEI